MTNRPWYEGALFALPLVGFLAGIAKAEITRLGAPRYELAIEGYDPRDLVRGNYLLYRFVQVEAPPIPEGTVDPNDYEEFACVVGDGRVKRLELHRRSTRPASCKTTLSGGFVRDSHRFYIQADKGPSLEAAVRGGRASVVVVHPPGAAPEVEKLLVDGQPASEVSPSDAGF